MNILYYGDCSAGAMGIIHRDIKSIIDKDYPEINFELLDWTEENRQNIFNNKGWKNYDIIITDPSIATILANIEFETKSWFEDLDQLKDKLIAIYHHELDVPAQHFRHGWYDDWFTTPLCGINPYIVNQINERGTEGQLLPIGVNTEKFKPFKEVKKIKKIGWVGNGWQKGAKDWKSIKRPDIFKEIGESANVEYVTIFNKPNGPNMYDDIDAILCTSTAEGNPMAFMEAAACKIPFISTNVGIIKEYSKVKTFNTVDEAVSIINELNASEDNIKEYVNEVYNEIFPERNWSNIITKYWIPYFNKMINIRNGHYDFIEIGTSDFSTLLEQFPNQRGISVEPIAVYFNALPEPKTGKKIMCAISDYDGTIEMNWVHPDDIRERNLPDWIRGCNSIGNHPAREKFADSLITRKNKVKTLTWYSLVQHHNIETVDIIKIDTEGHEHIILSQILNHCKVSNFRPKKIIFESHGEIVANDKELEIISKEFIDIGYHYTKGYDSTLIYNKHK